MASVNRAVILIVMKKTRKNFEEYLNEMFGISFTEEQAVDYCSYFKQGEIRKSTIIANYHKMTLGGLLRVHDPTAFNVLFKQWVRNNP